MVFSHAARTAGGHSRSTSSFSLRLYLTIAIAAGMTSQLMAGKEVFERSKPHVNYDPVGGYDSGIDSRPEGAGDLKQPGPDQPDYPDPSAHLSRGALHVQGTQQSDRIDVELNGSDVEVTIYNNANPAAPVELYFAVFNAADVDELRLFGLAGKDLIQNKTSIPDFIWGGLGNDDIIAGDGVTYAFGQQGDDIINGNGGNDYLAGNEDTDYVFGGSGSDYVEGNDGVDVVSGGYNDGSSDNVVDLLVGGADGDYFVDPPPELAADILDDFNAAEDGYW